MLYIFSPDKKFTTWRRLWIALARAEKELGLPVTQEQIDELERPEGPTSTMTWPQEKERELRHDVMAHVHAYGAPVPQGHAHHPSGGHQLLCGGQHRCDPHAGGSDAGPRQAGAGPGAAWPSSPEQYKALPTLGFTHFQAAQLVTVGKRATLWMNELLMDLEEVEYRIVHSEAAGLQGHHRHPGQPSWSCSRGTRRRCKAAGAADRRGDGL